MRDEQLTTVRCATGAELISAMMGVTNGIALAVIGLEPGWSCDFGIVDIPQQYTY
jgi:hypothetical protein